MVELLFRRATDSECHWWLCCKVQSGKVVELEAIHADVLSDFLGDLYAKIKDTPAGEVVELKVKEGS